MSMLICVTYSYLNIGHVSKAHLGDALHVASDTWASRDAKDLSERMLDMPTVVPGTAKERFRVAHTIR